MKNTLLISIIFLFISCHCFDEDDYKNNCNQECQNQRVCIDKKCQCPPNTYVFDYECIPKDSAGLYHSELKNSILECKNQAVIYAPKSDTYTNKYEGVFIEFENGSLGYSAEFFGFPGGGHGNKYYPKNDGDSIFSFELDFINHVAIYDSCKKYANARFYAKFLGEDTLKTWFYFYNFVPPYPAYDDSAIIYFVKN